MVNGGCLCGALKYEIRHWLQYARNCHCSMCRKVTGGAFATWAYVAVDNFRWTSGEEQLGRYQSSQKVTRTFCKICGSTMQYVDNQTFQDVFGIALGTIDGDPGCKPLRHVLVGSKAPWFELTVSNSTSQK